MDLSTDIGIQNFRRSLHSAFHESIKRLDSRMFTRRDGTIDISKAMLSIIDDVGYNTLRIMKSSAPNYTPAISSTPSTPSTPALSSTSGHSTTKKINETPGCGNIRQLIDDDDSD